jgi:hypothetical protein
VRTAVLLVLAAALLGSAAFVGFWAATGGRWLVVKTPSMGEAAPVGTLLWVRPAGAAPRVGDLIAFHPPTSPGQTYSHRVHAVAADGTITTKGDINAAVDPWRLHRGDVIGVVSMRWWGAGWLVRAAPILIVGGLLLWALVRAVAADRWREPLATVGTAFLISLAIFVVRPFLHTQQLSYVPGDHGVRATYVSTGVLPLRVQADDGTHLDLRAGQVGSITIAHPDANGQYPVHLSAVITWWWWLVLVGLCCSPGLWTLVFGQSARGSSRHRADSKA